MSGAARDERCGWRFVFAPDGAREALLETVLRAVAGELGAPLRRSRHATTWRVSVEGAATGAASLFVKRLDPPPGALGRLKRLLRVSRAKHVAGITEQLRRDGFGAPRVLMAGRHAPSGCEVVVTEQLFGPMLPRLANPRYAAGREAKRAALCALGAEIARLHGKGYLHGDLTPYNVLLVSSAPIRFAFLDHERSRLLSRLSLFGQRRKLRNLVQLGRFELAGVTRTDRMRLFTSYARNAGLARRPALAMLMKMLARRLERDRAAARAAGPFPAPLARPGGAGRG